MRIALHAGESEEETRFIRELGLTDVVSGLVSPAGILDYDSIVARREYFEAAGLRWDVVENLPNEHYNLCMFGLSGRDQQIDRVRQSIQNLGRAGIGVLQYGWMLLGGLRTEYSPTGRGGVALPALRPGGGRALAGSRARLAESDGLCPHPRSRSQ